MNNVSLVGRLTADPELRYTSDNRPYVRAAVAVDRNISKEEKDAGKQSADFISCVFWNKNAENLAKFMKKGSRIAITGQIRTGSYDLDDGTKRYTTDVRVISVTFLESKSNERPEPEYDGPDDSYKNFEEEIVITDDDLPF